MQSTNRSKPSWDEDVESITIHDICEQATGDRHHYFDGLGTMLNRQEPLKAFRVRVGHWEVHVRAIDADSAVDTARRQMARELPRLYDVIRSLTTTRFQVEAAV